ncbi:MAG: sterol desaturase family protein [Nitrospirota bacterium]|nr:MAG: sterol desaturase family protein [Nitrospirota bacterium]
MTVVLQTLANAFPVILTFFTACACFTVVEWLFPVEPKQPIANKLLSAQFSFFFLIVNPFLLAGLHYYVYQFVQQRLGGSFIIFNLDQFNSGSQAINWPLRNFVFPLLVLFIFDFFYYWHHRIQHKWKVLWAQHKLHHAEESLCCFTDQRHHWLEDSIRVFTITIPMGLLLSLTPVQGALLASVLRYWTIFIHSNVRLPFGPFSPIMSGPQLHRIHHSRELIHQDKNLAAFFPIWDILFGTYHRPLPGEWPKTGLASGEKVTSLKGGLILPFLEWSKQSQQIIGKLRSRT